MTPGNWIGVEQKDFTSFLPIADRDTKSVKVPAQERAIFHLYSLGLASNRDEWVYSFDQDDLKARVEAFVSHYERERMRWDNEGHPKQLSDWVNRRLSGRQSLSRP